MFVVLLNAYHVTEHLVLVFYFRSNVDGQRLESVNLALKILGHPLVLLLQGVVRRAGQRLVAVASCEI